MSSTRGLRQPQRWIEGAWGPILLVLVALLACVLVLYRDTAMAMVTIWSRSETFAHAFTVPPIVAWLIWRKRHALAEQVPEPNAWLLLPIGAAGVVWLLGDLAAVNAVTQLAFTALLVLVVVAVLGPRASRTIAFPLGFLFFSVPVGEFVMPQMMEWTADFTVFALRSSGIPVFREGQQFVIPSGNWSVVEACSGIRYLVASLMVGVLFAYLNYRSLYRRLTFVAVSIVVPIVANWIRAYLIVLVGHLSNNKLAAGVDHIIYGWVFFGLVITLMFLIGSRWTEQPADERAPGGKRSPIATNASSGRLMPTVAVGAAVLLLAPHLALWAVDRGVNTNAPTLAAPTALESGWQLADGKPDWRPAFSGAAAEFNRTYVNGAQQVNVFVAYYRHQDYDQKLVSSENTMVTTTDERWTLVESGRQSVAAASGSASGSVAASAADSLVWRSARLRGSPRAGDPNAKRLVAWQIYWINGTWTSNETWAKVCSAFRRLLGHGDDAAVVIVSTPDAPGINADALLQTFLSSNLSQLNRQLTAVRAQP
ncbi:exosortase A [soil metagenome]